MIRELAFTEEENEGLVEITDYCYNIRQGISTMQDKSNTQEDKALGLKKAIEALEQLERYKMLLNDLANELILEH